MYGRGQAPRPRDSPRAAPAALPPGGLHSTHADQGPYWRWPSRHQETGSEKAGLASVTDGANCLLWGWGGAPVGAGRQAGPTTHTLGQDRGGSSTVAVLSWGHMSPLYGSKGGGVQAGCRQM